MTCQQLLHKWFVCGYSEDVLCQCTHKYTQVLLYPQVGRKDEDEGGGNEEQASAGREK